MSGQFHCTVQNLHENYGDVVRVALGEVSLTSTQALKHIYTQHDREGCFPKDTIAYTTPPNGFHSLLTVRDNSDHSRYRQLFNYAFSGRALHEQAPLLKKYIDLLIDRLRANANSGP